MIIRNLDQENSSALGLAMLAVNYLSIGLPQGPGISNDFAIKNARRSLKF